MYVTSTLLAPIETEDVILLATQARDSPCLVPRPHYSAQPKRFGSRGPNENVKMFPNRSPRIRHRNELTERDWENAVQGLGKDSPIIIFWTIGN